jgi:hypothetical protein
MMTTFRKELKSDMSALEYKVDAGFRNVDSKLEKMSGEMHRMLALMEEQRNQNQFIFDGYVQLQDQQARSDARINDVESFLETFKR